MFAVGSVEFYQSLPAKRMAAGALILNEANEILLVKPDYKNTWEVPGGIIEDGESPRLAVEREIKEELSISVKISRMLCLDYMSAQGNATESLQMIFLVGNLTQGQQSAMKPNDEVLEYRFFPVTEINKYITDRLNRRLQQAFIAYQNNSMLYLENGQPLSREG